MKIISFSSNKRRNSIGQPVPIKRTLPQWYKDAESTYLSPYSKKQEPGLKKCMPYVDIMMSGYALVFPTDVHVSLDENGNTRFDYDVTEAGEFLAERPANMGATMPRPYGFAPNHLVFTGLWGWKTPRGYSTLVTHPFNRTDLPFHTISAFMDSDEFGAAGNIPFFIREGWEGTIKAGTVFAQILPVKRDIWKMVDNNQGLSDKLEVHAQVVRHEETSYKRTMWHRKEYN